MDYEHSMPMVTGGAGAVALMVNQLWLPTGALILTLTGALAVRWFFRRRKNIWDRS
ncbi:MAG: hypothetical protein J2P27_02170 [Actinobacteria bacterium]|nr:hypothetical protein [Actinomycetota bacterium]